MAYLTLDEAKQALGVIYDSAYEDIKTGLPNEALLQDDVNAVSSLIDSYIQRSYSVAITGPASLDLLRKYAAKLLKRQAYDNFDNADVPEAVLNAYDDTILRLRDLAKGVASYQTKHRTPVTILLNLNSITGQVPARVGQYLHGKNLGLINGGKS